MTFKTDVLFKSPDTKPFQSVNICGQEVEVRRVTTPGLTAYFNAYAFLPHSGVLSDSFLGHPTFRHEDWVGVDTAHSFNDGQSEAEKVRLCFVADRDGHKSVEECGQGGGLT